jgi:DNA repair exonuclease SbcCD nuclease subunit
MARFLHTADWHLGKTFHSYSTDPDTQARLRSERLAGLDRLTAVAHEKRCDAILVAGDLFHSNDVDDKTVTKALEHIGRMRLPVVAIPGNHDHAGAGSVWERRCFVEESARLAPNLRVVLKAQQCLTVEGVDVLCSPVLQRMQGTDLAELGALGARDGRPRLGLVHASTVAFSEDQSGRNLKTDQDARADLDYLALGEFHMQQTVAGLHCPAWYSGTHEPDGLMSHHRDGIRAGACLIVTIEGRGQVHVEPQSLKGGLQWIRAVRELKDSASATQLLHDATGWSAAGVQQTVCQLDLTGSRLGLEQREAFLRQLQKLEARYLSLQIVGEIQPEPTQEELHSLTGQPGLIGQVARQLTQSLAANSGNQEVQRIALSRLYELSVKEVNS